jgi:hypothetical protein
VGGTLTITRRDVAQWVGGSTGNWFDPANWADGAVPTLSNVANVLIPSGVVVTFDTQGALAGVPTGPVILGGLGQGGSLLMNDGALNVGSGGINLAGLTQTGGALESVGSISLGTFTQSGGITGTQGSFTTTTGFTQTGGGTLDIGGNAAIGATNGPVTLGNLSVDGNLAVESKDGPIRQSEGTHLAVEGTGNYTAKKDGQPADIALGNAGNDLGSKVSANGANVALAQEGALTLGTTVSSGNLDVKSGGRIDFGQTTVGGDLHATSAGGGITQSGPLHVAGTTGLAAGTGDIALGNGANSFGGAVSMRGNELTLVAGSSITLGNVDAAGALTVNSGSGQITQAPGTSRNVAGGVKIGGPSAGAQSITPFIVPAQLNVAQEPVAEAAPGVAGQTGGKTAAKAAGGSAGSCDPAVAADIYRSSGGLATSAAGCSAQ